LLTLDVSSGTIEEWCRRRGRGSRWRLLSDLALAGMGYVLLLLLWQILMQQHILLLLLLLRWEILVR